MILANTKRNGSTLITLLGTILWALAPVAHADTISPFSLPPTEDEFRSWNGFIGGTAGCTTTGTYDPGTFAFTLSGPCTNTGLQDGPIGSPPSFVPVPSVQASLDAVVNNSGQPLSGAFSLSGAIPGLGIGDVSLLATGTLVDLFYGPYQTPGITFGTMVWALIDLDFSVTALAGLGSSLLWVSHARPDGWGLCAAGDPCNAWQSPAGASDWSQYTGSQYFFYDGATHVPEPGTLVLFGIGLVIMALGLARHRKKKKR